jgi:uncharacterized protein
MDNAIIIFVKNPVPGKVKTRLAAAIGNDKALRIYLELTAHTLYAAENVMADKYLYFSDEIDNSICKNMLSFRKAVQSGAELGERMKNAFKDLFAASYQKVIVIGTDCPGINAVVLQSALNDLSDADVVIGPASDGGYYLIGMKQLHTQLFDNVEWSTSSVLHTTVNRCIHTNLRYKLLSELNDIDEEKDLVHYYRLMKQQSHD